jgi:predicted nucleic acid-binding protein
VIVFIDSNVPMYVAGREHPNREPSRRLLAAVQRREIDACTSAEVLQEILYRYSALKRLDLASSVYDLFVKICPVVFDAGAAPVVCSRCLARGRDDESFHRMDCHL